MKIIKIVVGLIKANCYLLVSQKEAIVVDPGGDASKITNAVKKEGVSVKYIVNTHGHFDHCLVNKKIETETRGDLKKDLQEGDEIEFGESKLKVLSAPGHTKDSICLLGEGFLIGGDVLFPGGHGRTDLPGGSKEEMEKTLERLKREISEDTVIYPGHGENFTMKEWKDNY